ncbi:MAG: Gfo/Idh/MocA family oxidoreductase [Sandaracinaceae bacterium]|nr:Gfo/Idh/MocA family oxidoreductase [Sandaracinaceae bacterium]
MTANFALLGIGGFVAPRHLKAISDNGGTLVAACDPFDSVGVMDRYFPDAAFFTEVERFDRFLEKRRRESEASAVQYVSVCSPNYLHDAHCRLALRLGAHAICEKPLVINPWNLDQLSVIESESSARVYTVLQLRLLPSLIAVRARVAADAQRGIRHQVVLSYATRRGRWYDVSWKGNEAKSGGLVTNIGIHLMDLLVWMFGAPQEAEVHQRERDRVSGFLALQHADVRWLLSTRASDLPQAVRDAGGHAHRTLTLDGDELEFSSGFTDLHSEVYREILAGRGFGIEDARPSIELSYKLRTAELITPAPERAHPHLEGGATEARP